MKDERIFSVQKGVRGVPDGTTLFPTLLIHSGKQVRELETLKVLLSPTIVPLEIPPPGDSSSRSTLP